MDGERCIHGMVPEFCSFCNEARRTQEDLRRKSLGVAQRVNARLDSVSPLPDRVLALLLAGRLELTAPPQHESTLREQWLAATGQGLDDSQVAVDDHERERFGTGCWYWYSKVTFRATDDEADLVERVLNVEVKAVGVGLWSLSSNTVALFLGSRGMKPRKHSSKEEGRRYPANTTAPVSS